MMGALRAHDVRALRAKDGNSAEVVDFNTGRSYHVTCVTLASGLSMASAQSPGSAPNPRQQCSQVAAITAGQLCGHTEAAQRTLSALRSAPPAATSDSGASSKMSSSVQQSPVDEARRCRLLRHRTRTHKFRRHRVHAMLWDERREGLEALREWP